MAGSTGIYQGGTVEQLTQLNGSWAQSTNEYFPALFPRLKLGQSPKILWIGCSDSRVAETTLLGLLQGEVFVHRNIANLVNPQDASLPAALHYAVEEVKVTQVIICGHIGCGGVKAACASAPVGVVEIDTWLDPLRAIRQDHHDMLSSLSDADQQVALVKLNVQRSLKLLSAVPAVNEAMTTRSMQIHGAIYDVGTGLLKFLDGSDAIEPSISQVPQAPFSGTLEVGSYYHLTNLYEGSSSFLQFANGKLTCTGQGGTSPSQRWLIISCVGPVFRMKTDDMGANALTLMDDNSIGMYSDSTPISAAQCWKFQIYDDKSSYKLTNLKGGYPCLDVYSDGTTYTNSGTIDSGAEWIFTKC